MSAALAGLDDSLAQADEVCIALMREVVAEYPELAELFTRPEESR